MALTQRTLKDRLKLVGLEIQDQYFTLDQATREVVVTRWFMASTYGGNMEESFPTPAKKFYDKHGMNDFMYLRPELQPEAPQLPAAPGLWFCIAPSNEPFEGPKRVFAKMIPLSGSKKRVYQFMGMYQVHPAVPPYLTVEEYGAQTPQVGSIVACISFLT